MHRSARGMNFIRNQKFTTALILVFVVSVILFKLVNEPYMFDPRFGAHSVYGFSVSDAKEPFTVYYIARGMDFTSAKGDFQVINQTLQIGDRTNTSTEWVVDVQQFLSILKRYDGEIGDATLFFSKANPWSTGKNASVLIHVNDQLVANLSLSTIYEGKYTWEVATQWDIPGSNFGYPYVFAVFSIPPNSMSPDPDNSLPARIRLVTSEGVNWNIDYVVLKLYSDPHALRSPWWRQNFPLIFVSYVSVSIIALALVIFKYEWKRKPSILLKFESASRWLSKNRFILFCFGTGLLTRLVLMVIFPLGSGDQYTYRLISIATYYYGVDTRSFYGLYGTIWHGLLLLSYPIYLFISQFASSISLEYIILKFPILASDIFIAFLLYRIGNKLADEKIARTLLVFWLFNPYVIWLSPIWGTHHIVPTMLTVFAVERVINNDHRTSAIALSAAVLSGLNNIFLLPVFLILIYKSFGKPKLVDFSSFFLLGSSIFVLPWAFSIGIFFNTYSGAGRTGFPSLSYSYFMVPSWLAGIWSAVTMLTGLTLLCAYLIRKNKPSISQINDYILIVFLTFFLTNVVVFPTYVVWSLPFLLFVYVSARKVPFSYVISFMVFPLLWILYWGPPLLPNFFQASGTGVFRDTFGVNFSFVSLFLLTKLSFSKNKLQANPPELHNIKLRLGPKLVSTQVITITTLIFIVFAPWIKEPLWLTFWDGTLKPSLFVLSIFMVLSSAAWNWRRSYHEKEVIDSSNKTKEGYAALVAVAVILVYNAVVLVSSQVFPLIFSLSPFLLHSQDDIFFSSILLLWLPFITHKALKIRQSLSFVAWITLLQTDYIITRHYSTYIVTNVVFNTYVVKDMLTFVVDAFAVTLMLAFSFLTIFYKSKKTSTNIGENSAHL